MTIRPAPLLSPSAQPASSRRPSSISPALLLLLLPTLMLPGALHAQAGDSAFLACAAFSERSVRLACLEQALAEALAGRELPAEASRGEEAADGEGPVTVLPLPREVTASEELTRPKRQSAEPPPAAEPADDRQATVASLREYRPNLLLITLSDGSSWRQTHPRRFNLREGQAVRIYPSRWGDSHRLEAERLSGFIQVAELR